ncbi:MAG: histidine kinase [Marinilabiliaceae bacterium]|nr:histidine kinase [Marinilabiliaceae bacterium]
MDCKKKSQKESAVYKLIMFGIVSNVIGLGFMLIFSSIDKLTFENFAYNAGYSTTLGYGLFLNGYLFDFFERKWINWVHSPARSLFVAFTTSTIGCTIVIILTNVFWYGFISGLSFQYFQEHMMPIIWMEYGVFYFIAMWFYARSFLGQWRGEVENREKLKREALALQYEALKTQVNPHFLFNSLNVLTSLIDKDVKGAKKFTAELSRFYRDLLQLKDKELITINEELTILRRYIFLQQIRFGKNFNAKLPEDIADEAMVIPLSVQMLVENTFKHNIISSDQPLSLKLIIADNQLTVTNTYQPKTVNEPPSGIGIQNLTERYQYLTGKEVTIYQTEKNYSVTIPLIYL